MKNCWIAFILFFTALVIFSPCAVFADDENLPQKYFFDDCEFYNAGKNDGYSKKQPIKKSDHHFGWRLGRFYITGFTDYVVENKIPIFLKNAGDEIKLAFSLEQDINRLNNDDDLSIAADIRGYNQFFEVAKQNFGVGTLITRFTDYQNKKAEPVVYTDYLKAVEKGADTQIVTFEEGNYEVVLNYKIKNNPRKIGSISIAPTYADYSISFSFAVRNGNCMVFPFDTESGNELTNESFTENGFYLDLANSRYLDIFVKREVLTDGQNGQTFDTRFNKPAKDGDKYTDEGVYTITATNNYTKQTTTKVLYVGDNPVLKAYVTSNLTLSVPEINEMINNGASVNKNGDIVYRHTLRNILLIIAGVAVILTIALLIVKIFKNKKSNNAQLYNH